MQNYQTIIHYTIKTEKSKGTESKALHTSSRHGTTERGKRSRAHDIAIQTEVKGREMVQPQTYSMSQKLTKVTL